MATAAEQVKKFKGPMASVYYCPHCKFAVTVKHSRPGDGVGRGYGLATSSMARAEVVAHIKTAHTDVR